MQKSPSPPDSGDPIDPKVMAYLGRISQTAKIIGSVNLPYMLEQARNTEFRYIVIPLDLLPFANPSEIEALKETDRKIPEFLIPSEPSFRENNETSLVGNILAGNDLIPCFYMRIFSRQLNGSYLGIMNLDRDIEKIVNKLNERRKRNTSKTQRNTITGLVSSFGGLVRKIISRLC